MGVEVPAIQTPVAPDAYLEQAGRSHLQLFGAYPSRAFCLVLLGQCYAECGEGGRNVYDFNVGNVQKTNGFDWDTLCGAWEIENGVRVNKPEHFRAFHSLEEGITQHIAFLHSGAGGRYAGAFAAAMYGDCAGFVHALKAAGYFTGSESDYIRNVSYFFQKYSQLPMTSWEQELADASSPLTDGPALPYDPSDQ